MMLPVPLIDVRRSYDGLRDELLAALEQVCASGHYVLGPEVERLEQSLADYCQVPHAIGCASGSDALLLAMMACGVGPGDEVLLPSFTFFATASAVTRLGAKPVFVDIDPATYSIDPAQLAARITPASKAVVPVHLYGQCADMEQIDTVARAHQLVVIEDAAQAIGAEFAGRRAGSWGDMGCFSFYPTKNLGGMGDGGMLTARDAERAQTLRLLRGHGMQPRYYHQVVGINSRLDAFQAAVLNVKFPHLEGWTQRRREHAERYQAWFAACGLDQILGLPVEAPRRRHAWNQYVIRVPDGNRDALREHLAQQQIATEVYYPVPLHEQECFRGLGYRRGALVETERAARETLALPVFAELAIEEQLSVVRAIATFFGMPMPDGPRVVPRPKFFEQPAERVALRKN